jgi:hypothetical protein
MPLLPLRGKSVNGTYVCMYVIIYSKQRQEYIEHSAFLVQSNYVLLYVCLILPMYLPLGRPVPQQWEHL